ncbi:EF-P lysine aminoacylase EpmA [Desulfobulbus propionicus]
MLTPEGLRQRSRLLQAIRSFFLKRAYIEVDTPIRLPVLIPEFNILPFASEECVLQTSPEICMKRLLARGCERIFQICHCFRKEELGRLHQPEFSMLEWYRKKGDYLDLMAECETLIATVAAELAPLAGIDDGGQALVLVYQGGRVDLCPPWERLTVAEACMRYAGVAVEDLLLQDRFDEVLVTEVEPHLGRNRPTFLYDYPVALGSLARRRQDNAEVAERFELYIAGVEIANGFSELADPDEQRIRFANELVRIHAAGRQGAMPEKFLADLPAMGEAAGIALGVDRLFMLLRGGTSLLTSMPFIFEEL